MRSKNIIPSRLSSCRRTSPIWYFDLQLCVCHYFFQTKNQIYSSVQYSLFSWVFFNVFVFLFSQRWRYVSFMTAVIRILFYRLSKQRTKNEILSSNSLFYEYIHVYIIHLITKRSIITRTWSCYLSNAAYLICTEKLFGFCFILFTF